MKHVRECERPLGHQKCRCYRSSWLVGCAAAALTLLTSHPALFVDHSKCVPTRSSFFHSPRYLRPPPPAQRKSEHKSTRLVRRDRHDRNIDEVRKAQTKWNHDVRRESSRELDFKLYAQKNTHTYFCNPNQDDYTWPAMLEEGYAGYVNKKAAPNLIQNGNQAFEIEPIKSMPVSLSAALNHYLSRIVARAAGTRILDVATSRTKISTAAVTGASRRLHVAICLVIILV